MKINTKFIYNDYISELKEKKKSLNSEASNYENSKEYLLQKITIYKHYIDNFTNIKYKDIANLERLISEKSLIYLVDIVGINVQTLRRDINVIVEINRKLAKIDKELTSIEEDIIGYLVFKDIIYKFNEIISDEIIYKGYILSIGYGLGNVRIKKINCLINKDGSLKTKKRIDWNESNKKKAEIIARGSIPFKVLERGPNREILKDNGGEYWYVYHNKEWDYLWIWYKGKCQVLNSPYFKFRPTIYNNTSREGRLGNVNKLKQLVTMDSPLLVNFTENIVTDKGNKNGNTNNLWKGSR